MISFRGRIIEAGRLSDHSNESIIMMAGSAGARLGRGLRLGLLAALIAAASAALASDWKPGERPKPNRILSEAEADARAGRYAEALAKHVWLHETP